ncbi:MAG: hypothetical protein ACKV1O_09330 [Saprospiraceae bacterium]
MSQFFIRKPHLVLWLSIPILLALTLLSDAATLDLQLHDTYIIFTPFHFMLLVSFIVALLGGIYWMLRHKKLVKWMTITHLLLTLAGIVLVSISVVAPHVFMPEAVDGRGSFNQQGASMLIVMAMLVLVLVQLLFLVNVVMAITSSPSHAKIPPYTPVQ